MQRIRPPASPGSLGPEWAGGSPSSAPSSEPRGSLPVHLTPETLRQQKIINPALSGPRPFSGGKNNNAIVLWDLFLVPGMSHVFSDLPSPIAYQFLAELGSSVVCSGTYDSKHGVEIPIRFVRV